MQSEQLQFFEHPVGNAVLSVPTAKRHIFVLQIMEIIRILGHRTPKFFRNSEDSVPYSVFQQNDKLQFETLCGAKHPLPEAAGAHVTHIPLPYRSASAD